jgi:heavy metal translocating P-type ATPase
MFIQHTIDIHALIVIAVIGAILGKEYFDASLVVSLFIDATLLESFVVLEVKKAVSVTSARAIPKEAFLANGTTIAVDKLKIGDILSVRIGEMILCDGTIVKGDGVIDESALTGESFPVQKKVGMTAYGGTVVQNGYLEVQITKSPSESLVNRLHQAIEEVSADRGHYATLVDRFSLYWTPFVIVATLCLVVIGGGVSGDWWSYVNRGLVLLILACPCAIVISAPIPSICAISNAAQRGVLIRGSTVIEKLAWIDTIAVDKTGTLTKGFFTVNEKIPLFDFTNSEEEKQEINEIMLYASSLEQKSTHPLANAIISDYCGCLGEMDEMMSRFPETKKIKVLEGVGIEGWVKNPLDSSDWKHICIGNERLLKNNGGKIYGNKQQLAILDEAQMKSSGKVLLIVVIDDELKLLLSLSDEIRSQSKLFISFLEKMNLSTVMLTGDHESVAMKICEELNISQKNCYSRLLPEDKLEYITYHQDMPSFASTILGKSNKQHLIEEGNGNDHEEEEEIEIPLSSKNNQSGGSNHHSKKEKDVENQLYLPVTMINEKIDNHASSDETDYNVSTSMIPHKFQASSDNTGGGAKKRKKKNILMVGDGINDSTALAAASVGVAMGSGGSAMAVSAADVVLMTDNLLLIPFSLSIARYACRTIIENGVFAIVVKIIALVLAIMGKLKLWEAVLIDVGSLILVVINGTKVLRFRSPNAIEVPSPVSNSSTASSPIITKK